MLDLTVPLVEVWFAGAKLGEYANDLEALKAASLHADSLPLLAESVEYEIRRDTMKYIVHRRITGPDAPALGPVLTISSTELTVTLDRPATGPTTIDRYELERLVGSTWTQIASGLDIFGSGMAYPDTGLSASTSYSYRCRAVDTTSRASEYSYSSGTTGAGAVNQAPVWTTVPTLSIQAGSSVDISGYASDPEGDQLVFSKVSSTNPPTMTMSAAGVMIIGANTPAGSQSMVVKASDGLLSANKTINLTVSVPSTGNEFFIETGVSTYNASQVQPGDIITIRRASSSRSNLTITGIQGTQAQPIVVRSDPLGQVLIRAQAGMSGGFVLTFSGCEYFEVDGSQTPGSTYGIKVAAPASGSAAPSSWIQFKGASQHYSIHHVDVDGGWPGNATFGVGIQVNDHAFPKGGGRYIDGVEIHHCRVQNTNRTAMYVGPNYVAGDLPLKNVLIHENIVSDVGGTGICVKNAWTGTNKVYGNTITNAGGLFVDADQRCGITFTSSTGEIYDNVILDAGSGNSTAVGASSGIRCYTNSGPSATVAETSYGTFATFPIEAYNNLVVRAASNGIQSSRDAGTTVPVPTFYNNTVVNCGSTGINTSLTSGGFVRNNIALGNSTQISSSATETNNLTSGVTVAACFVDSGNDDYHLAAERAAVGTPGTDISATDIEGTSRAGTASKGAYEFS